MDTELVRCDNLTGGGVPAPTSVPELPQTRISHKEMSPMIRTNRVAGTSAFAAVVLPGTLLLFAPAAHAQDPPTGEGVPTVSKAQVEYLERIQLEDRHNKAQVEYFERSQLTDRHNKAQIEHDEQLAAGRDDIAATPDEFPWAIAALSALGLAAATGGVIVLRHGRAVSRSARPVASDRAEASKRAHAHIDG
jgi:hypothetical protein